MPENSDCVIKLPKPQSWCYLWLSHQCLCLGFRLFRKQTGLVRHGISLFPKLSLHGFVSCCLRLHFSLLLFSVTDVSLTSILILFHQPRPRNELKCSLMLTSCSENSRAADLHKFTSRHHRRILSLWQWFTCVAFGNLNMSLAGSITSSSFGSIPGSYKPPLHIRGSPGPPTMPTHHAAF